MRQEVEALVLEQQEQIESMKRSISKPQNELPQTAVASISNLAKKLEVRDLR